MESDSDSDRYDESCDGINHWYFCNNPGMYERTQTMEWCDESCWLYQTQELSKNVSKIEEQFLDDFIGERWNKIKITQQMLVSLRTLKKLYKQCHSSTKFRTELKTILERIKELRKQL